jgi:hypothetical protein
MIQSATFSTVSLYELKKAGVKKKTLDFVDVEITNLRMGLSTYTEAQIKGLHAKIKLIYACVNMDVRHASI